MFSNKSSERSNHLIAQLLSSNVKFASNFLTNGFLKGYDEDIQTLFADLHK